MAIPTRYLWSAASTPAATQRYLTRHALAHQRLPVEHHWPWIVAPGLVATSVAEFVRG